MRLKYLVIIFLISLIAIVVYFMIQVENRIRREKIIVIDNTEVRVELLPEYDQDDLILNVGKVSPDFNIKNDYFQIKSVKKGQDEWQTIFLKGVNLGVALPGKFPSEFPIDFDLYMDWFIKIGAMNSNVIRVYTILPPVFYEAFANYNLLYSDKPLYLMQGVWASVPETHNYLDKDYSYAFQKEIKDVIDVIHGNKVLDPVNGKASGTYVSDVSKNTIAYLLGREWEPQGVTFTNQNNSIKSFNGEFISIPKGSPMEIWLAQMMDYTYKYETLVYQSQRPVSFVNWLPLDPMYHISEFIENEKVREYDNDWETIDFRKFNYTERVKAGIYAAYHVYPYYPDFVYLDVKYRHDENNYLAYLKDLKDYCPDMPLIIAEYGVPSSRGNSHFAPYGFNQGGQNEIEQARINSILTKNIHDSNCGGAIIFEWIDEWFKLNWMVMDFEQPQDRTRYWHNKENPEQNFGVLAIENRTIIPDGQDEDWAKPAFFADKNIQADADPSYFYLKYKMKDFDFKNNNLHIAIDTYDEDKGEHSLSTLNKKSKRGIEFFLSFMKPDSAVILVDDEYSVFSDIYNDYVPIYSSKKNDDGRFVPQELIANRARETLLGEKFPQRLYDRSNLIHGKVTENSNADWFYSQNNGILEIRLAWHLLNISDPSSLQVLDDKPETPEIESSTLDKFYIYSYITNKQNETLYTIPEDEKSFSYIWEKWDNPKYEVREKVQYDSLKILFGKLKPIYSEEAKLDDNKFAVAKWFENRNGAISISFDDAGMGQFLFGFETLKKYNVKATFGVVGEWISENPQTTSEDGGFGIERMGWEQIRELVKSGNEISSHGFYHKKLEGSSDKLIPLLQKNKDLIEKNTGKPVFTLQYPYSFVNKEIIIATEKSNFLFGRIGNSTQKNTINNLLQLSSKIILNNDDPNPSKIQSYINEGKNEWTIFMYHHIFENSSKEMHLFDYHNVYNRYSIAPKIFDNQVRLMRNSNYWIAPISEVGKYLIERENAQLIVQEGSNSYMIELVSKLDSSIYNQPLTVIFSTNWSVVKISNTENDGIYNPRNNQIIFSTNINKKVIIERVK
ncbi:MAG: polysaccharide deacetylase family protein [Candidatus Cloacimonetes bacterium]|nr:polysaccharide deacetylase family protein [Candidatus Cloacimonadota bacterium]